MSYDPQTKDSYWYEVDGSIDYLRMGRKQSHVTCGNRLAIERKESFQNFQASRRRSTCSA